LKKKRVLKIIMEGPAAGTIPENLKKFNFTTVEQYEN